jgi:hypothetical protein
MFTVISATEAVHRKPDWDWDAIVGKIVEFWLHQRDVVGRGVNYTCLRQEFEGLFEG